MGKGEVLRDKMRIELLTAIRLPGRLSMFETGTLLGMTETETGVLIRCNKLSPSLRPLGDPGEKAAKFFASSEVDELRSNPDWLSKATKIIQTTWRIRNSARKEASQ